jgi:hypothetical protein
VDTVRVGLALVFPPIDKDTILEPPVATLASYLKCPGDLTGARQATDGTRMKPRDRNYLGQL